VTAVIPGRSKEILRDRPCNLRDKNGRIWCWFFPGLISKHRQRQLTTAILLLSDNSRKGLQIGLESGSNWRVNQKLYRPAHLCSAKIGAVCYSPCWYEQGRGPPDASTGPSLSLVNDPDALQFLRDTQEVAALLGAILSLIHPALFAQGMELMKTLYKNPHDLRYPDLVLDTLAIWASPFTALSIISNRSTPMHHNTLGGMNCFDAVMSWGEYENGRFKIPAAGMTFRYDSGTTIYLDTQTFRHGASAVVGECFCFVLFFRPSML
ncbi:hypothetical protein FA13DRAFT_1575378, partial [Coprinellus micaceus]